MFYLRYHGYAKFFPLWALARYRNLKAGNSPSVAIRHVTGFACIVCRVIAVTGLAFEARIAAGAGVTVILAGDERAAATAVAATRCSRADASGIISFGSAGGLDPDLEPGDWIVADAIIDGGDGALQPIRPGRRICCRRACQCAPCADRRRR